MMDPAVKIAALNRGGRRLISRGLRVEAVKCFTKALDFLNDSGLEDHYVRAALENNLGHLMISLENREDALSCFTRAKASYRRAGDSVNAARQEANRGSVFRDSGRLGEALSSYRNALAVFAATDSDADEADQHGNVAYILALLGDGETARVHYEKARFLYAVSGQRERAALVEKNLKILGKAI